MTTLIPLLCFLSPLMAEETPYEPTTNYEKLQIQGWSITINKKLLHKDSKIGRASIELLSVKLYDIKRVIPKAMLPKLQQAPIWLEVDGGKRAAAEYHPSRGWLTNNGFNPEKEKSVELRARRFLSWSQNQPSMVLHELAHAYHHRIIGFREPRIKTAFENAKKSGKYEKVLNYRSKEVRHYALNDHKEYFAEMTEAFFGVNDFYPFVRAELKVYDPGMFKLLMDIWNGK